MIERVLTVSYNIMKVVELFVALLLTAAVIIYCIRILPDFYAATMGGTGLEDLSSIISAAFSLIIGIEFIKMICKPTTGTVVEVLMFAIARGLIVDHASGFTSLLGVLSIAALFATKKFLFCDFDGKVYWMNLRNS